MRSTAVVVAAEAVPAVAAGIIVGIVMWAVGATLPLIVVPALVVAALVVAWLRSTAAGSTLRALGSRPVAAGANPRLENIVEGLCTTHGFQEPALHIVETAAVNAAATGMHGQAGHLIVTRGAIERLDRLELEAVVARQLCEIRRGVESATALASVGRLPGARIVAARLWEDGRGPREVIGVDIEAVRLTCYPPGLASALKKAVDAPSIETAPSAAHLWMVSPKRAAGQDQVRLSALQRVDVLGEV